MKLRLPKSVRGRITAAVGFAAAIVGIGAGIAAILGYFEPGPPKPPKRSAVFVLDVSHAMQASSRNTTNLAAAEASIIGVVRTFPDIDASLRIVRDGCDAGYTKPTVGFTKRSADRFEHVFANLNGRAVATYAQGLNSAVNDLTAKELIADSETKLLYFFAAVPMSSGCFLTLPIRNDLTILVIWFGTSSDELTKIKLQLKNLGFNDVQVSNGGKTKKDLKQAVVQSVRKQIGVTTPPVTTAPPQEPTVKAAEVPDVVARSVTDATQALNEQGFAVESSEVFSPESPGVVIGQSPEAGTSQRQGVTVTVTVSKGPGAEVPDVVARSVTDATQALNEQGFAVESSEIFSPESPGVVIGQSPEAGTSQPQGVTVTVTVSKGPGVEVPDVKGLAEARATAVLEKLQLTHTVHYERAVDPSQVGIVIGEDPSAGTRVELGAAVTITVGTSINIVPPSPPVPNG